MRTIQLHQQFKANWLQDEPRVSLSLLLNISFLCIDFSNGTCLNVFVSLSLSLALPFLYVLLSVLYMRRRRVRMSAAYFLQLHFNTFTGTMVQHNILTDIYTHLHTQAMPRRVCTNISTNKTFDRAMVRYTDARTLHIDFLIVVVVRVVPRRAVVAVAVAVVVAVTILCVIEL